VWSARPPLLAILFCPGWRSRPTGPGQARQDRGSVRARGVVLRQCGFDLLADLGIVLAEEAAGQGVAGSGKAEATQGPGRCPADQRLGVAESLDQCGQAGGIAAVAQDDGGVAEQASPLRPGQGRAPEQFPKGLRTQPQPADQIGLAQLRPRLQVGIVAGGGLAVPGADLLADIAAEDPGSQAGTQVAGDRLAQLDG
jgi:hypothetical protein